VLERAVAPESALWIRRQAVCKKNVYAWLAPAAAPGPPIKQSVLNRVHGESAHVNAHGPFSPSRRDVLFLVVALTLCSTAAYMRFVEQDTSRFAVDLLLFAPGLLLVALSRFVRAVLVRNVLMIAAFALIAVMLIARFLR